jgi:hypothetical protein
MLGRPIHAPTFSVWAVAGACCRLLGAALAAQCSDRERTNTVQRDAKLVNVGLSEDEVRTTERLCSFAYLKKIARKFAASNLGHGRSKKVRQSEKVSVATQANFLRRASKAHRR